MIENLNLKDIIQISCQDNEWYELAQRTSFVPGDILEKLLFETLESAEKILTENGY